MLVSKDVMSINISKFKKEIKNQGQFKELAIYPYFSNDDKVHGKVVVLSDKVDCLTYLTYRNKKMAIILPYDKNVNNALLPYKDEISYFVGVLAPVFSIYNLQNEKIGQFQIS